MPELSDLPDIPAPAVFEETRRGDYNGKNRFRIFDHPSGDIRGMPIEPVSDEFFPYKSA